MFFFAGAPRQKWRVLCGKTAGIPGHTFSGKAEKRMGKMDNITGNTWHLMPREKKLIVYGASVLRIQNCWLFFAVPVFRESGLAALAEYLWIVFGSLATGC